MLRRAHAFLADRRGLAAVEFGLIAPVMIIMFFGAVELAPGVDCNSRVARVSATVSDLVAQETTVSSTDTTNIFSAAGAILFPYSVSNAQIVVSSLVSDTTGKVTVAWSDCTTNTTKRTTPPANIPSGILPASSSVIYAEINYAYTPPVSYFLGPVNLKSNFYSKPRRSTKVVHT